MGKNTGHEISQFITLPTIYRVIAYFELVSDRSIVLDFTWDYTMAWYPAQKDKDNIQWHGTQLKRCQSYAIFHYVTGWPQMRMTGPVHSFGHNMALYHGLVPSSQDNKE